MKTFPHLLKTQVQVRLAGWRLWDGTGGEEEGTEGAWRGRGGGHGGGEGKEEGRGGGREMAVLWGPSSPCLGLPLGFQRWGLSFSPSRQCTGKGLVLGQEEVTCVGVSRVVAAH